MREKTILPEDQWPVCLRPGCGTVILANGASAAVHAKKKLCPDPKCTQWLYSQIGMKGGKISKSVAYCDICGEVAEKGWRKISLGKGVMCKKCQHSDRRLNVSFASL